MLKVSSPLLLLLLVHLVTSCPVGWTDAGGEYCYLVSPDKMNWPTAQVYCWDHGGWLAELFSAEEEGLLDQILLQGGQYWLGLTDTAQEGEWRWQESHHQPEYTNWASGEPNNVLNEDCAHISSKEWYDAECSYEDNFLQPIHALCQAQK